jgi:hypothetical protein
MFKPFIHILAGEKVCIQVMSPIHFSELLASEQSPEIDSGVVRTGLKTIFCDIFGDLSSAPAIFAESAATCLSVSGPYKCWLPVTNQTSLVLSNDCVDNIPFIPAFLC